MKRPSAARIVAFSLLTIVESILLQRSALGANATPDAQSIVRQLDSPRGICVVLDDRECRLALELARASELVVLAHLADESDVATARDAADAAGLLNSRVYIEPLYDGRIHLADNLADAVITPPTSDGIVSDAEISRVLRPGGKHFAGTSASAKPVPAGVDGWSHPYHGPDNNPLSSDQLARAPYLTQFIAEPKFIPSPALTVSAGGRIFRACGHQAHKANQNAMLNTLLAINAYNGTILWRRPLSEGFMILRNTMIATPDTLYLGDDQSCKLLDAATGAMRDEILSPDPQTDGPVWKWMGMENGVLCGLLGAEEFKVEVHRSDDLGVGGWPRANWPGFDYRDPETAWAQGRAFAAFDAKTRRLLWRYRSDALVDGRAVCMRDGRLYFLSPERFLACLKTDTGQLLWKTSDPALLAAIGPLFPQLPRWTGLSPFPYVRCNERFLFFCGPRMARIVAVSTTDGKLLWQKPIARNDGGSSHLLLRPGALYAVGDASGDGGVTMDYETGAVRSRFYGRRGCTMATGSADSIFYRAAEGTIRVDLASGEARHIACMRPPCDEGVIVAGGMLHWGAWKCRCPLSLYGNVTLAPAGDSSSRRTTAAPRLKRGSGDLSTIATMQVHADDWPCYQGNNERTSTSGVGVPKPIFEQWAFQPPVADLATAPIAAGGMVFTGDHRGAVRALDASNGKMIWRAHTGAAIFFPPTIWEGRLYVGSADGRVYAFESKTARLLWVFRAAPTERRIPVFGKLISTWPVAGGVVVKDGVVYAAAGIANHDGTHVYALDAVTGELKWHNGSSGTLSEQSGDGVSLQGELFLRDGELRFAGGNACDVASYDLETGRCLSAVATNVTGMSRTAFYPYYPEYGQYMSLNHKLADGSTLNYTAYYSGDAHSTLALLGPLPASAQNWPRDWRVIPRPVPLKLNVTTVWEHPPGARYNAFIIAPGALLAASQSSQGRSGATLTALKIEDGAEIWRHPLPAPAVKGGIALDNDGRIIVSLQDGRVLCFSSTRTP